MRRAGAVRLMAGALLLALRLHALAAPAVAARVDGEPLLSFSVDAMWRMAQAAKPAAARQATLDALIENRLLAAAARKRYGEAALSAGQRVAFAREVQFDEQLVATLRTLYGAQMEQDLRKLPGGMDGVLRPGAKLDEEVLASVFGKTDGLMLGSTLDAAQLERARAVVLLRYALPGRAEGGITLFDVYQRQNVQGRVALFAHDREFMLQQARQAVAALYVMDWSRRRFGEEALADLRAVLSEQADAQALMRLHGVGDDGHADTALLDELARKVGAAEVRAYYRQNRSQFVRIAQVRARHIRLPDERGARMVAAQLAAGADFADLAKRHSVAPDAASGGSLGWIKHEGTPGWLAQLLFAQPEGQVSPPVRTPAGPGDNAAWEIVLVEQREQGYQEIGSEAVRYVASRAIAREAAVAQLTALRKDLRRKARIEIAATAKAAA